VELILCGELFSIVGVIMLNSGPYMIEFIATGEALRLSGHLMQTDAPTLQYLVKNAG
jgi:hypothetical protein